MANRTRDHASIGCGTLILIAIIVAIFSGRGEMENLERDVFDLTQQVKRLEEKLDHLTQVVEARLPR